MIIAYETIIIIAVYTKRGDSAVSPQEKGGTESVFKYLKKYWIFALLAPLCMIGEVSMDLLQPQLMSTIVD